MSPAPLHLISSVRPMSVEMEHSGSTSRQLLECYDYSELCSEL